MVCCSFYHLKLNTYYQPTIKIVLLQLCNFFDNLPKLMHSCSYTLRSDLILEVGPTWEQVRDLFRVFFVKLSTAIIRSVFDIGMLIRTFNLRPIYFTSDLLYLSFWALRSHTGRRADLESSLGMFSFAMAVEYCNNNDMS